jgi:hypothetical protein
MSISACAHANVNSFFNNPISSKAWNYLRAQRFCNMSIDLVRYCAARFGVWS